MLLRESSIGSACGCPDNNICDARCIALRMHVHRYLESFVLSVGYLPHCLQSLTECNHGNIMPPNGMEALG